MTNIKIQKSGKKEGYAFIDLNGKHLLRKVYTWKTGKFADRFTVDINADVYSFIWLDDASESSWATDIRFEHNYSKKGQIFNSIKAELKAKAIEIPEAEEIIEVPTVEELIHNVGKVQHEQYETIKKMIEADIPVYLVGPAGSGKNHTLEMIAEDLGMDFYFTNSIQQEFKVTGFIDAGGNYHETEFYKAFNNGGLFFLDELDASIPEVLVLLNAAIANRYFEFPNGKVTAREDFRVVSAGNTFGAGADEQYTGRLVLDASTLDRFAIVPFDYSLKIEMHLAKGNTDLVSFVRELRTQAKAKGIRATFSYRCITMVTKLEGKLSATDIMTMAIMKGMDQDTVNTFTAPYGNKYSVALKAIQHN